ncbi:MAG: Gfo/Idh/MocA family protein [Candidatus Glassbacteria bacterium]
MVRIGVIGCGYWGPNLIRNFKGLPDCEMVICCDKDEKKLKRMESLYGGIQTTTDYRDLLVNDVVDAVAIATPVWTHYPLTDNCLNAGKHVLVEKPFASSSRECISLINIAKKVGKVLMVGHTFEYTASVNKIKEIVQGGELGEILYISSTRVNLGLFQKDINVIWDLAPHDISIILYVLEKEPILVSAQGRDHFKKGIEDVALTTLNFDNGTIAFLHNSWLDPNKIRRMVFVGSKKMLLYDDVSPNEKIKIYDKGVEVPKYYDTFAEFQFAYRYGDIHIPLVDDYEPLKEECSHFIECIKDGKEPRSDGYSGLRVVEIMEAANESIRNNGYATPISAVNNRIGVSTYGV